MTILRWMGQDLVTERHAGQKGGEEHKANTSFKENMKKKDEVPVSCCPSLSRKVDHLCKDDR